MIDPRALELAKSQGYRPHGNWQHMFCDFEFWKCLAKAVEYEGEPWELAQEFLPLIFGAAHPEDLEEYQDEDYNLQSAWDELVEPPAPKEEPIEILKPEGWWCRHGGNVSKEKGGRVHAHLRLRLGEEIYASWFASLEFYSINGGLLTATVPVKFLRNWIKEHYADDLLEVCSQEFDGLERVEVVLRQPGMSRMT